MFRNRPSVAHQLFNAINDDDLPRLQNLLGEDPALLLVTDLSAPQLEQEIVGANDFPVGKFPRVGHNNTLLNFALLLDRMEIACELVQRHIQHNQQEIFYQVNHENSFPLYMAYNLQCEYSVKYQQRRIVVTKVYTVEEKAIREQQALQLANVLLSNIHNHPDKALVQLSLVLGTLPGVIVIPQIAISYLRTWLQKFGNNDPQQIDVETTAAIGNYLILLQMKSYNIEASTQEVETLIKRIQDNPGWDAPHSKEEAVEQIKAQLKLAVDMDFLSTYRIKIIINYIKLMQGDVVLNALLTTTLSQPYVDCSNQDISSEASSQPDAEVESNEVVEVESADEYELLVNSPLIFQLVYPSCQDNFVEEYRGVHADYRAAIMLLSPPVIHLRNAAGFAVSEYLEDMPEIEEDILLINDAEQDFLSRVKKSNHRIRRIKSSQKRVGKAYANIKSTA